jgi:membrane protein YdbS with pleckstrin-like domain
MSTEATEQINKTMSEETLLFRGSSSIVVKLGSFLLAGIIFVAALVFAFLTSTNSIASIALWSLAAVSLLYLAGQWLLIRCRVYEITTERIRVITGILTRKTEELELYRVQDSTLIEPVLQRMLGLGNLHITTNDASTPQLRIEAIRGAREVREQLRKSIEACRDRKRVRVTELE